MREPYEPPAEPYEPRRGRGAAPPPASAPGYEPPGPGQPEQPGRLPHRAPGEALGRSSLARGGRSTGDPRYTTGSNPVLPTDYAPPGPDASGGYGAPQGYAEPDQRRWDEPGPYGGPQGYAEPDQRGWEAPQGDPGAGDWGPPQGPAGYAEPQGWAPDPHGYPGQADQGPGLDDGDGDGPDGPGTRAPRQKAPYAALDDAPRLPNVPGFDGLRALALIAVLLWHQGYDLARGGFLGVSSAFTLSGFLLATLGLAEWAQTGRLALTRLWERRARRIVPAYAVTLAIVVVLQFVLRVGVGPTFRADVLWATGFASNWRAVLADQDVASVFIDPSPVQHLWAIAVLVQLLVVLPLAFVGLMRASGRHWRLSGAVFAAAAVVSFLLAHLTAGADGNGGLAFYGTHTRAGELLVGVALAYAVLSPVARRVLESPAGVTAVRYGAPAALVALAYLWSTTSLGDARLFGGLTALNAVLTAFVVLAVTASGPASTFLSAWPLRTLGRFSFTAYLIHWPVYMLVDEPRLDLDENLLFVARVALTLALAAGLHYAIEQPWRQRLRRPRPQVGAALVGGLAVVAVAAVVLPQQPPPDVSLSIGDGNGAGELDVVAPTGDEAASVALVGDQLAGTLPAGFTAWNDENGDQQFRVHTHVAEDCPPGAPGPVRLAGATVGEATACTGWEPRLPHLLDEAGADVVMVLSGIGELGDREIDGEWRHLGDPLYDDWLRNRLADLADTLAEPGVPVLWATIPHVRLPGEDGDWTDYAENDPRRVDRYNDLVRRAVGDREGFQVVDLTAWAQELPRGGEFSPDYRQDGATFTEAGAAGAVAWLAPTILEAAGADPGAGGDDTDADAGSGADTDETTPTTATEANSPTTTG